jgi:hypothetical protein
MSVKATSHQSPNTDAAEEARLADQQAANAHHRRRVHHRRVGHRKTTTFKHAAPSSQAVKPRNLDDGRRRLAANGLPHKVTPRHGEGGGQNRQHSGGGRQNGQHGGQKDQRGRHGEQRGGQNQQRQRQQQQQPRENVLARQTSANRRDTGGAPADSRYAPRVDGVGAAVARPAPGWADSASNANGAPHAPNGNRGSAPRGATSGIDALLPNELRALVVQFADRPLMLRSALPEKYAELQLRTGASSRPTRAQIALMLDMLGAHEVLDTGKGLDALEHGRPDTLEQVAQLLIDMRARLTDLVLPDPDTEVGQTWFLLTPLALLTGLRSSTPGLRERSQRHLRTALATLAFGGRASPNAAHARERGGEDARDGNRGQQHGTDDDASPDS